MAKDDGREFRFRPRKPPARSGEREPEAPVGGTRHLPEARPAHSQRCAVLVICEENIVAEQGSPWALPSPVGSRHGDAKALGFDHRGRALASL
jgi:hypothetical protein